MSIESIREQLHSPSEDARFNAWMILYQAQDKASEYYQERELVYQRKDPLLKMSFLRFLSKISEERSIVMILRFFPPSHSTHSSKDENKQVLEAAFKAFKDNTYNNKFYLLLPFLKSSSEQVVLFCLEEFSNTKLDSAFWPILQIVKSRAQNSKVVLNKALSALRHYPDSKSFSIITDFLCDPDEEVRFLSSLVLGSLYEARYLPQESFITKLLCDPSPRIRKAILWVLRRRPQKKYINLLTEISLKDQDSQVRQEALQGLGAFPNNEVIAHFIYVIENDTNRMVGLKSEAVLRSLPAKKCIKAFWSIINAKISFSEKNQKTDQKIKIRALIFLAEFQPQSKKVFHFISARIADSIQEKETIPYFEALQFLDRPEVIFFLEPFLLKGSVVSYMALKAMIRVAETRRNEQALIDYLKTPSIPSLHQQMILSFLVKSLRPELIRELRSLLISFLTHENTNIRYLSLQLLKKLSDEEVEIYPLIESLKKETDQEVRLYLEQLILEKCTDQFASWKRWVEYFSERSSSSLEVSILIKSFRMTKPLKSLPESVEMSLYAVMDRLLGSSTIECKEAVSVLIGKHLAQNILSWDLFLEALDRFPNLSLVFPDFEKMKLFSSSSKIIFKNFDKLKQLLMFDESLSEEQKRSFFSVLDKTHYSDLVTLCVGLFASKEKMSLESEAREFLFRKAHTS